MPDLQPKQFAKPKAKKIPTRKPAPTYPTDAGGRINAIDATEQMYGTGSKQHKAALAKWYA